MAEPPTTTPLEAALPERDVLLATKLHVPRPRLGFVPRPRLLEKLSKETAPALTLVCAPAGFGKTSALAEWASCGPQPVAWLSLDRGDSDPARFWRYVAAALDRLRPEIADRVAALLQGPQQPPLEAVLTVVVNQLAGTDDEVVLVLDDYHLIDDPAVHASLTLLLERSPPQLRLVLASRADPPLPLARLRASGQLSELREADLRFTVTETAALLRAATGLELPADSVAVLEDRTEGWVAGLQLAALSLSGRADPAGFMASFSGSHRYVLDYLTEEILARQPEELVRFLLETSVLERLCGSLCDALTGRDDSQRLLEQIERANLFLVPLDDQRRWWRYHHLFADLLQVRLQQQQPGRTAELHQAAAAWCEQHDLGDDAIRHALAADDPEGAARLIERHLEEQILRRSEGATMARWLAALPIAVVRSRPRLCFAQALTALLRGRADEAEPLLEAAERAFDVDPDADEAYLPSVGRAASILANLPAVTAVGRADVARLRGDAEREAGFARQALAHLTEQDGMQLGSFARYHLAVADWLGGRPEAAERGLAEVVAGRAAAGERYLAIRAGWDLGHLLQAQGRLGAALRTYQQGLELASDARHPPLPAAGMAQVGMAEVLYERDQLDAALEHATDGVALCRQLAYTPPLATGLVTLARVRHAQGDQQGALDALDRAEGAMPEPSMVDLFNPAPTQRARLLLANSDPAEALRLTRQRGLSDDDQPDYSRERAYLLLARVLLVEPAPERAVALLGRLRNLATAEGRVGGVLEVLVLQALALEAAGDKHAALAALVDALRLAAPEGYLRVILDEGAPMAGLLGKLATNPTQALAASPLVRGHLDRLIQAFHRQGLVVLARPRPGGVAAPGLVEPLSARELQVLQLLADGRSNQRIADELVISLDTVKRHVSHVLGKLQAANRTQAVARARNLGLLG